MQFDLTSTFRFGKAQSAVERSEAKRFDSLFIYQAPPPTTHLEEGPLYRSITSSYDLDYPVCVEMEVVGSDLIWRASCKARIFDETSTENLLSMLEEILQEIVSNPEKPVLEVDGFDIHIGGLNPFTISDITPPDQQSPPVTEDSEHTLSETESSIISALSTVARIPHSEVSTRSNIFHLGLDSISVIKVSALLRKVDISLTVSEILQAATVQEMAALVNSRESHSLLDESADVESVLDLVDVSNSLGVKPDEVEYVAPALAGQLYMLSLWEITEGTILCATFQYTLKTTKDLASLKTAWCKLVEQTPLLRTIFGVIRHPLCSVVQAVIKNPQNSFSEYPSTDYALFADQSRPQAQLTAQKLGDGDWTLRLTIHHALYDAVSLPKLMSNFIRLLASDANISQQPNLGALQHIANLASQRSYLDRAKSFWTDYLKSSVGFPQLSELKGYTRTEIYQPKLLDVAELQARLRVEGISIQALFLAVVSKLYFECTHRDAGSLVEGQGASDVVVGVYLANRSHAIAGLLDVDAPTLNLLPLRVRRPLTTPLRDCALQIQDGLREIGRLEHALASLWQIDQWTGVNVDIFVNFLSLPADEEGEEDNAEDTIINDEAERAEYEMMIDLCQEDFIGLKGLRETGILESYRPPLDVEAAVRNGSLDVGLFGFYHHMRLEESRGMMQYIKEHMLGFVS